MINAIIMRVIDKPGVLRKLTQFISEKEINIIYTYIHSESEKYASTYLELEDVQDITELMSELNKIPEVEDVKESPTMNNVWGKRIIIMGGGAQVSQVALGAITEADRHNIRGERISVDTVPLAGEQKLEEAVRAVGSLSRVGVLVLAGSLMGGSIVNAIDEIKEKYGIKVISLNMVGSVVDHADLVVTDPVQAGVMAVMAVANTAKFDIDRVNRTL
ncbi:DUF5612 domain-containing protein [Candidatus Methanosphaera massiliense]|jgi:energy-converting hydrogenase B subunit Q|uniref:DUF5612 domain-containing protein n=1 Tax=Methanosphaera TaxID=2316 RepID=UPI002380A8DB|nr:DUF5612 domain-containing protein [Candidatus Methanosphaera massiliense]MDD6286010.1 DUF5612 domain-containing protein [Methanobacteriaceae archaeon]MDE4077825.1 DUF5612 domain-containing protein [Candidatus Methanosphaera massiliense]MDY2744232.1 DUF5612 domain-containing protein [Methanosphaera sp.]